MLSNIYLFLASIQQYFHSKIFEIIVLYSVNYEFQGDA